MSQVSRPAAAEQSARAKLFGDDRPAWRRYAELTTGRDSLWALVGYELITSLAGPLPGAVGLALRKVLYPRLFAGVGRGVIFGRNVVVRHGHRIRLGDHVVLDDGVLLDARGGGDSGIVIGDRTVVNRGSAIQAKGGPVRIGNDVDIGSGSTLTAPDFLELDDMVGLGGHCNIGGLSFDLATPPAPEDAVSDPLDPASRGQARRSRGGVRIGRRTVLGGSVSVLDGVEIGADSAVGAGVVVRSDVPPRSVVLPRGAPVVMDRDRLARQAENGGLAEPSRVEDRSTVVPHTGWTPARVELLVDRVLTRTNAYLPPERRVGEGPDAPLLEPRGPLDSMGFINLVVALEEEVEEEGGSSTVLWDRGTPDPAWFLTRGRLASHLSSRLGAS